MKIQLIDMNENMCKAWLKYFKDCEDVSIHHDDFFAHPTDCVVSPANSFGFMDGSLDLAISQTLGWHVQEMLQTILKNYYGGELLVGQAIILSTGNENIPYCISAPTMRVPMILGRESVNVYLATKAIFNLLKEKDLDLDTITISGLGTGVGRVPFDICARQMRAAYDIAWVGNGENPSSWHDAQKKHQLLYKEKGYLTDLQFK